MEHLNNKSIKLPEYRNYEYAYNQSFKLASERLAKTEDFEAQCQKSGACCQTVDGKKIITLQYLNQTYRITVPEISIAIPGSDEEVPIRDRILILHYILTAKGTPLSNKLITFKELPEGIVYIRTFSQRTIKHLLANFSQNPQRLVEIAEKLGGRQVDYGDEAVTINAFARVPITLVLWQGDAEFAPEGNVLYDSTVTDYLPTEDIIVLSEVVVWKLVRMGKNP